MKRFCLALDLIDDEKKIKKYQQLHQKIWPEIAENIRQRGVVDMQIWQVENRLFMIMDTTDDYDENKAQKIALAEPKNIEWEELMWEFQQSLKTAQEGVKWVEMEQIFDLKKQN